MPEVERRRHRQQHPHRTIELSNERVWRAVDTRVELENARQHENRIGEPDQCAEPRVHSAWRRPLEDLHERIALSRRQTRIAAGSRHCKVKDARRQFDREHHRQQRQRACEQIEIYDKIDETYL